MIKPKHLELFLTELKNPKQLSSAVALCDSIHLKIDLGENPEDISPSYLHNIFKSLNHRTVSIDAEYWFFECMVRSEWWPHF